MNSIATTEAQIAHIDGITPILLTALVKVTVRDGTEVVGVPSGLQRQVVQGGVLAQVTLTTISTQKLLLNLLDIAKVESAFLEHRAKFVAAGVLDLAGDRTMH